MCVAPVVELNSEEMIFQILTRLGFIPSLTAWPHWSAEYPRLDPKPLSLPAELGGGLCDLVASLLRLDEKERPAAKDVLETVAKVIVPGAAFWSEQYKGVRGSLPRSLLVWLQEDPDLLSLDVATWSPWALQLEERDQIKTRQEFFGKCNPSTPDVCNAQKLRQAWLPMRLRQWVQAFKKANQAVFDRLDGELHRRLGRFQEPIAKQLCQKPSMDWALCFGSVQKIDPVGGKDRRQVDGPAGCLRLILALRGRTALHWETQAGEQAMVTQKFGSGMFSSLSLPSDFRD